MLSIVNRIRATLPPTSEPEIGAPSGRSAARWGGSVELLPASELASLADEVAELAARAAEPNVFYDPGFLAPALACFASPVALAVVRREPEGPLVGFLPLARRPLAALEAWRTPFVPFTAPLLDDAAPADAAGALLTGLGRSGGRLLRLELTAGSGPAAAALRAAAAEAGLHIAPLDAHRRAVLPLDGADPLAALSGKKRKEIGRLRRRLAETGRLEAWIAADEPDVARAAQAFLALEEAGWKGRRGSAMAQREELRRLFLDLTRNLAAAGRCRIAMMTLDGKPLAAAVALISGNRAFYWKTAYDEGQARFSPGVLVTLDLGEALRAEGQADLIDSCAVPGHPMVEGLWPARRDIEDLLISLDPHMSAAAFGFAAARLRATLRARMAAKAAVATLREYWRL